MRFDKEETRYSEWIDDDGCEFYGQINKNNGQPKGLVREVHVYDRVLEGLKHGHSWVGVFRQINADGSAEVKYFNEKGHLHG